jgi:hypothetical protein
MLPSRRAKYRRGLTYLLLVLIAYGATVAAVHGHGKITGNRRAPVGVTLNAGDLGSTETGRSQHSECLMCQFQQQLFSGLLHAPLFALTLKTRSAASFTPIILDPITASIRLSDRAPPRF